MSLSLYLSVPSVMLDYITQNVNNLLGIYIHNVKKLKTSRIFNLEKKNPRFMINRGKIYRANCLVTLKAERYRSSVPAAMSSGLENSSGL